MKGQHMPKNQFSLLTVALVSIALTASAVSPAFAIGTSFAHTDDPAPADPAPWVPWQPQTNPTSGWIPPTDIPWTPSESLGMGGSLGTDPAPVVAEPVAAAPRAEEPFEPAKLTVEQAKRWTGDDVAKLTAAQVAAIPAASLAAISPDAFIKLNVLTIRAIPAANIPLLPAGDFPHLPWQVASVLTPDQLGALTPEQVKYFNVDALPPQNVKYLSTDAISVQDSNFFGNVSIFQAVWFSEEQAQKVNIRAIHGLSVDNDASMFVAMKAYFAGGANAGAAKDKLDEYKAKFGTAAIQLLVRAAIFWYDLESPQ
jgi:hypothetical protein